MNRDTLRPWLTTFAAAFLAVTVAYAVVLPFGWWGTNVLALGLNFPSAALLTLVLRGVQRTPFPGPLYAGLGVVLALGILIAMTSTIPSQFWLGWSPMFLYLGVTLTLALALNRAFAPVGATGPRN